MKIVIDVSTEAEVERVFSRFKEICTEEFQEFKLEIEGENLSYELENDKKKK